MLAVLLRPRLWLEAVRAVVDLAPLGWWRRPPFVPRLEPKYLAWRVTTAYGDENSPIAVADAVAYLEWRKRQRSSGVT